MLRPLVTRVFGLDPRSLAVLRIGLGALVLADLAIRATALRAHYTDAGVLPRDAAAIFQNGASWSLHLASGEPWFQAVLFILTAAAAAALVVGYRARTMAFTLFVLLLSLQNRNPMVVNAGDVLLRTLLLWSALLPVGGVWSVDRRRGATPPVAAPVVSVATAGLVVQIALVYICTGVFKVNDRWGDGGAMATVFGNAIYARPLAGWLLQFPALLAWVSRLMPWIEIAAGVLLLVPFGATAIRLLLIPVMIAFHAGIELTITVGLFGAVSAVAWLSLLPTPVWARAAARFGRERLTAPAEPGERWTQAAAGVLLAVVVVSNLNSLSKKTLLPEPATDTLVALGLRQTWDMFGRPNPRSGYYLIVGRRDDGSAVELLTGQPFDPLTVRRPERVSSLFPNHRWRKYYRNLSSDRWQAVRQYLARPLCDAWNAEHPGEPLVAIEVNYIDETSGPSPRRLVFYRGVCPTPNDIVFAPESSGGL